MSRCWQIITLTFVVMLASCASNEQVYVYQGSSSNTTTAQDESERAAELERQVSEIEAELREEQLREEIAALEEDERRDAEDARLAEERLQAETRQAEQQAAAAAEARRQQQRIDQQEENQQQANQQQTAERAEALARQQARIEELRAQISANNTETENLDSASDSLREAITAAEDLSGALGREQQKYSNTDPVTGETLEELATATLDDLNDEIERLRAQAQALQSASQ